MSRIPVLSCLALTLLLATAPAAFAQPPGLTSRVDALEAAVTDLEALVAQIVIGPAEDLAVVRGTVLFDESVSDGAGFTVLDGTDGDGQFTVIFTPGTFSATPTVLIAPLGTANETAKVDAATNLGFDALTAVAGVPDDLSFRFVAIGPQ